MEDESKNDAFCMMEYPSAAMPAKEVKATCGSSRCHDCPTDAPIHVGNIARG